MSTTYTRKSPCKKCPFRTDVEPYLRPERAEEIAQSLYSGSDFPCHETTVPDEDNDSEMRRGPKSKECAGALIVLEKEGFANQMMRISERLGLYDRTKLDMDAPVYRSMEEWVKSYRPESDLVHCEVVSDDCEDPPGYSMGGGAARNVEEGTCLDDNTCWACGNVMCAACQGETTDDGETYCVYCEEEQD